ncbi:MAG: hypothetical protein Ct9H300mP9_4010 [Candidatus Neomarinimicrobiota bacterium]|nr:MAG: hypothetical protein Ct9H300mP9_4010 [Candidatus Neomarinimicrobiota bacterium]
MWKNSDEGYLLKIVEVNDIAELAIIGVTENWELVSILG